MLKKSVKARMRANRDWRGHSPRRRVLLRRVLIRAMIDAKGHPHQTTLRELAQWLCEWVVDRNTRYVDAKKHVEEFLENASLETLEKSYTTDGEFNEYAKKLLTTNERWFPSSTTRSNQTPCRG